MPNWCDNELSIRAKSGVLACLDAIKGELDEEGKPLVIDFQRIVPMPEILKQTEDGFIADMGRILLGDDTLGEEMLTYGWAKEKGIVDLDELRQNIRAQYPDAEEMGKRLIQAKNETGYYNWYEWRVGLPETLFTNGHWGTKWNACRTHLVDGASNQQANIGFATAWSPPVPVIIELSKQFPKLTFTLKYWEGGVGFRGILRCKSGNILRQASYDYRGSRGG